MKNVCCIVDFTPFRVECSHNFARQGKTYSSYKHANMFKCLIAVTPNGGACFVFEFITPEENSNFSSLIFYFTYFTYFSVNVQ